VGRRRGRRSRTSLRGGEMIGREMVANLVFWGVCEWMLVVCVYTWTLATRGLLVLRRSSC